MVVDALMTDISTCSISNAETQKQKGHQGDSPDIHWRCWRQASTSPVNTRAVTLMTLPFLWIKLNSYLYIYICSCLYVSIQWRYSSLALNPSCIVHLAENGLCHRAVLVIVCIMEYGGWLSKAFRLWKILWSSYLCTRTSYTDVVVSLYWVSDWSELWLVIWCITGVSPQLMNGDMTFFTHWAIVILMAQHLIMVSQL